MVVNVISDWLISLVIALLNSLVAENKQNFYVTGICFFA